MRWVAELEVLTPVIISSGETLAPVDYAVVDGELARVDTPAVLAERGVDMLGFEREVARLQGRYPLERLGLDRIRRHILYRLAVSPSTLARIAERRPNLVAFMRSAGRPYIPGSSLKGALRTALFVSWLLGDSQLKAQVEQTVAATLDQVAQGRRIPAKFAMHQAEGVVFGMDPRRDRPEPTLDAMRTLAVRDSLPLPDRSLMVVDVRVANLSQGRVQWFVRPGLSTDDPEQAAIILAEAVGPGTRLAVEGYIREDLLAEPARSKLRFDRQLQALRELKARLQHASVAMLEQELRWYEGVKLTVLADTVRNLLEVARQEAPVLAIGWGTGWRTKTAGVALDPSTVQRARQVFHLGRSGQPFPKSRKVVFEAGAPVWPLGWVAWRGLEAVKP